LLLLEKPGLKKTLLINHVI